MGTSSIYHGPVKKTQLLPSDYIDEEENNTEPNVKVEQNDVERDSQIVTWQTVKSDFSKYITGKSSGRGGAIGSVAKQYVRASGGTKALMFRAAAGKRSGQSLLSFFNSLKNLGTEQTLKNLQIEYQGKQVNEIMSLLVNSLATGSVTKEDIVAKKAVQDAMALVYDYIQSNNMDLSCLDKMPETLVDKSLLSFIVTYIWGYMLKDISSRLEKYEKSPEMAYEIEQDLKGYIYGTAEVEFKNNKDLINKSPQNAITAIMKKCFEAIEGII